MKKYCALISLLAIAVFAFTVKPAKATQNDINDGSQITEDIELSNTEISAGFLRSSLKASGLDAENYVYVIKIGHIVSDKLKVDSTNISQLCYLMQEPNGAPAGFFKSYGDPDKNEKPIEGNFFYDRTDTSDPDNTPDFPVKDVNTNLPDSEAKKYHFVALLFRYDSDLPAEPKITKRCDRIIAFSDLSFASANSSETPDDVDDSTDSGTSGNYPTTSAGGGWNPSNSVTTDGGLNAVNSVGAYANKTNVLCSDVSFTLPGSGGVISLNTASILGICDTRPILMNAITILLILSGIFFVISVIYSGLMLVQATSDDLAAKAKRNLVWSATGAAIIILANWIVPFIIKILAQKAS